jgi:hypothetical protein
MSYFYEEQTKSYGGARAYDAGLNAYRNDHRVYPGQNEEERSQVTRHIVSNETMEHYGVNPQNYALAQNLTGGVNYRMGSTYTNDRDRRLDNAFIGEVFRGQGSGYDAFELTRPSGTGNPGLSYQQQGNALGQRFEAAKRMYALTGDRQFYNMALDFKNVARENLTVDGRQWRMPKKH